MVAIIRIALPAAGAQIFVPITIMLHLSPPYQDFIHQYFCSENVM